MNTAPTAEAFLAQTEPDEDFEETEVTLLGTDPLISIAESLRQMVTLTEARDTDVHSEEIRQLGEAYDDLEAKHGVLYELVQEIEGIIKPSTSKLANSVREAIGRWRDPQALEAPVETPAEPTEESARGPQCSACGRYFADQELLDHHKCNGQPAAYYNAPAADAPVEEWREYARGRGCTGPDVDTANRSQIRTLLGIPQPTA